MGSKTAKESASQPGSSAQGRSQRFLADIQTIPNLLSISRIFMILLTAALYLNDYRIAGLIVGAAAGASDILDGWLARLLDQSTELGAILDRLSDLVMEAVAFTCLLHFKLIPSSFFVIYLTREYIVMSARLWVAERGEVIPSSFLGKRKTNLIMGSFLGLFAAHSGVISSGGSVIYKVGYAMMVGGLVVSYLSGAQYLQSFIRIYNQSRD